MPVLEIVKLSLLAGTFSVCLVAATVLIRRQARNHRQTIAEIQANGIVSRAVAEDGGFPPAPPVPVQAGARHLWAVRSGSGIARFVRVLVAS